VVCNHRACRAVPQVTPPMLTFATSEHVITVAGLNLKLDGDVESALAARLPVTSNLYLTYGQIIALGGDFFGDPDHPVCSAGNPIAQFQKNFQQLQLMPDQARKILQIA